MTTLETVKEILGECDNTHITCSLKVLPKSFEEKPRLPSRLIYVGSTEERAVRLHEVADQSAPYLALSHRWGAGVEAKRTKANYTYARLVLRNCHKHYKIQ
jgi:hypothetical protein